MIRRIFLGLTLGQRSLLGALLGFFFYGSWAYLVNQVHGSVVAFKAALVQGSYSFFLTLSATVLVEAIYFVVRNLTYNRWLMSWLTIVTSCVVIFTTSWTVNALAGTPEILKTVLPGYIMGSIFCAMYVMGLNKAYVADG